jgi:hypothetical protein
MLTFVGVSSRSVGESSLLAPLRRSSYALVVGMSSPLLRRSSLLFDGSPATCGETLKEIKQQYKR